LDEQANIDIDTLNAGINLNQQLRNPQNREVQRARRIWNEKYNEKTNGFNAILKSVKIPKQGVEGNDTRIRRGLQAVQEYSAQQKKDITELESLWKKRKDALQ